MKEKRRFVRLDINVNIKWSKDLTETEKTGGSKNISGGGICLMTEEKGLEVGDRLKLEFELPNEKVIKAKGKVAWIEKFEIMNKDYGKKYDVGIEFSDIAEKDREEIKKFIFMSYSKEDKS